MEFPEKVIKSGRACGKDVTSADMAGRMDLRDWQTVTIDGEDAKDLDDAVSLTRDGDLWQLGVHIADVTNYVQEQQCSGHGSAETRNQCLSGRPCDSNVAAYVI